MSNLDNIGEPRPEDQALWEDSLPQSRVARAINVLKEAGVIPDYYDPENYDLIVSGEHGPIEPVEYTPEQQEFANQFYNRCLETSPWLELIKRHNNDDGHK